MIQSRNLELLDLRYPIIIILCWWLVVRCRKNDVGFCRSASVHSHAGPFIFAYRISRVFGIPTNVDHCNSERTHAGDKMDGNEGGPDLTKI